ncbi:MAG: class I SAM-dependent methyltransferase [Terriglobales bacterium]
MGKFQIAIIRPQGYLHSEALRDVAETLQFGLRSLGQEAEFAENAISARATNILLNAHLLPAADAAIIPAGSIIYNLEPVGGANLPVPYYEMALRHQIWDSSLRNLEKWRTLNPLRPPVYMPLGYVPETTRVQPAPVQDIDVLFYGSVNERRMRILNALSDAGATVQVAFGVYGKDRDQLIARSKVVLDVHFFDNKAFNAPRIAYLLANSKAVVAERSSEIELEREASGAFVALPYDSLVQGCLALLRNDVERKNLEARGYQWFSRQRESQILSRTLGQSAAAAAASAASIGAIVTRQSKVSPAQVTMIAGTTQSPLVGHLQTAFNQAMACAGRIDPAALEIDGMSGKKYRLLINNLIANIPDARYLEIGTWAGSTLCSAINRNSVRATAIDNWSEFGGPKAQFLQNLERFKTPGAKVAFLECDFRSVDYSRLGPFNVYMFDGPHTSADQFDGIRLVLPALDDTFILIVDDWNHPPARQGTLKALHDLNLSVLHSFEIRTTLDGSHAAIARQASDWHNGYFLAVVAKPATQPGLGCNAEPQLHAAPV